jgi:hypothetical protein
MPPGKILWRRDFDNDLVEDSKKGTNRASPIQRPPGITKFTVYQDAIFEKKTSESDELCIVVKGDSLAKL